MRTIRELDDMKKGSSRAALAVEVVGLRKPQLCHKMLPDVFCVLIFIPACNQRSDLHHIIGNWVFRQGMVIGRSVRISLPALKAKCRVWIGEVERGMLASQRDS